ncbi:MAG: kinase/pyrophosphorylase, partial [Bacteroidetes bacterium]|nr:kinase/pyrophosphorylase [Bacteroidota bacterium]
MSVQDKTFYLLSDGTGETAELILSAAIAQFSKDAVKLIRIGHILSEDQVLEQLKDAEENQTLVFYTFVNRELAKFTD